MQFCLRTRFGESKESFGETEDDPIVGYGNGSGFDLGGFLCPRSLIINVYRWIGHKDKLTSSKAVRLFILAAVMHVNNMDLIHWADSCHTEDKE